MDKDDFTFAKLSDIKLPVTFRMQLEGSRQQRSFTELLEKPELRWHGVQTLADLYVTCQLTADNKPLTIPFRTSFKAYCDLPLSSQVVFTVWDIAGPRAAVPVGGSTFRLFGKKWTLRRGKHRLHLWGITTPSKLEERDEMGRLEKLVKKYERVAISKSPTGSTNGLAEDGGSARCRDRQIGEPLSVHRSPPFRLPRTNASTSTLLPQVSQPPLPASVSSSFTSEPHLWAIIDPEVSRENPVEDKHRRLVRSHRSSPYDRELKPNAKIRDELGARNSNYAPSQPLNSEEKDLIWKFRFYLFLKSVTWRDSSEVKQAVEELLPQWTEIDTDDALELLGPGTVDSRVRAFAVRQLSRADDDELRLYLLQLSSATDQRSSRSTTTSAISYDDSGLTDFLITRGVALEDRVMAKMYGRVVFRFMGKILETRTSKDPRPKKIEKLRTLISDTKNNLAGHGHRADQSSVFKSNLYPLLLYFQCSDGSTFPVIFKDGDDMRQDQLVIQLFTLMDRLLRKENLDLKLSPMIKTIAAIVSEHGNLLNYLRVNNPDAGSVGTSGVEPGCAGYCVVTYLLGVGDRHLDNLLVAPDVDFGYILGRDPKPFPPPVKVCKEMVDGMGGAQSPHYARFKNFCFTAFTILRKSANLILNLVALMVDANIPDIKHRDVHEQIQEKFRLDLTEEEAIKHFETLLNETSYIAVVLDRIHDLAQYWRS
ncbi:atypical/PIKK/PI3K protein kinase [Mycena alexandri]|uniref:Phosphatidylinositol 3-kinase VPS34 n=1 Tax=Mycena alexandri TaxID=1745969 RepID=A0AAD6STL6_9AGAR|nr:atypical/PIKK/PI3K protein kinase [Mycena alexandri]